MTGSLPTHYADPEADPGWEYKDGNGQVHKYPSIAIWTWVQKGYFPQAVPFRASGQTDWKTLEELGAQVTGRASAQYAKLMFLEDPTLQWYTIEQDTIQGKFTGQEMFKYFKESGLPYATPVSYLPQQQRGPPLKTAFKKFGQVLEEYMLHKTQSAQNTAAASTSAQGQENGSALANEIPPTTIHPPPSKPTPQQQAQPQPQPAIPRDLSQTPLSELMSDKDLVALVFADKSKYWFCFKNQIFGPYESDKIGGWAKAGQLPSDYELYRVPKGTAKPDDPKLFSSFEAYLRDMYGVVNGLPSKFEY